MKILRGLMIQSLLILFSAQLQAQNLSKADLVNNSIFVNNPTPLHIVKNSPKEIPVVKKYKRMKIGGIILTTVGTSAAIAGGLLIKKDNDLAMESPMRKDGSLNYGFGVALLGIGVPCILSGVPLWIIGDHKLKKTLSNVTIQASPLGAGLVYNF